MSTRAVMRTNLTYALGARTDLTQAQYDAWLNDALLDLCTQRIQIRSLEATGGTIISQVGVSSYSAPAGAFSVEFLFDETNDKIIYRLPGGFHEWLVRKQSGQTGNATHFVERGSTILLSPEPSTANITYTVYIYQRPTWAADDNASPSIEEEWHYAVGLVAKEHALRDLGDPDGAMRAQQEFLSWLGRRDTSTRRTNRGDIPQRGIQPAAVTRRSLRTGI